MGRGPIRPEIVASYNRATAEHVQRMYALWNGNGGHLSKKDIEHKFFNDQRSNGKRFTKLVWDHLNIDIEEKSALMRKYEALEARVFVLEMQAHIDAHVAHSTRGEE
jgi:hypothetical protein